MEILLTLTLIFAGLGWIHVSARTIRARDLIARFEALRPLAQRELYHQAKLETLLEMANEDLFDFWHLQSFDSHESQCAQLLELERELNERTTNV